MNQYEKPILSVFRTYCDCYLEYVNNWINPETFVEYYELDMDEWSKLLRAVHLCRAHRSIYQCLDYYYNIIDNEDYTEKKSIY